MTEHLKGTDFKSKVYDYEKDKEWRFKGDLPCIIDFYADWCAPCRMVAPILEEISAEYKGKLNVYKVNTEEEQELASVFVIRSIPSILFVPQEGQPQMAVGALPKQSFEKAIQDVFGIVKEQVSVK